MHVIQQVFGEQSLYDILSCPRDADKAQLRKAYYRAALKFHPDRNPAKEAHQQFQALSLAYQILSDTDSRVEYDETGDIPEDVADEDDTGSDQWKQYFDTIFGKVTTTDIDAFATKYKCSDEERRDVIKEFKARNGNLVKMLDFVMLSEPRDATRWVEDYIIPSMEAGEIDKTYKGMMEKTLKECQKKAEKENRVGLNDSETESEDEPSRRNGKSPKKKTPPRKAKPTRAKPKNDVQDLVAQIQNKKRGGGAMFASLGARYGVSMDAEDPLDDAAFAKIQMKMKNKKKSKK